MESNQINCTNIIAMVKFILNMYSYPYFISAPYEFKTPVKQAETSRCLLAAVPHPFHNLSVLFISHINHINTHVG